MWLSKQTKPLDVAAYNDLSLQIIRLKQEHDKELLWLYNRIRKLEERLLPVEIRQQLDREQNQ